MPTTHLLYFSAARVTLYRRDDRRLIETGRFAHDEAGIDAFAAHLDGIEGGLVHVLVDLVEEDFQTEVIPFVRGRDRAALLKRRLAQRYRDISLSMTASLGFERTQRREERVLLSACTNVELLEPWLTLLVEHDIAVSGVYSPGLLAPAMARALGLPGKNLIIVSVHEAGLRQTYLENGRLRFSRLSPLSAEDAGDRERLALALGRESGRIYQYLRATNVLPHDHPPVDVVVIAPPGEAQLAQGYMPELAQLKPSILDQRSAAVSIGLDIPAGGAQTLFLHLLAQRRPVAQYAPLALRKPYRNHQIRLAMIFGGALIGGACLIAAAATLWHIHSLKKDIAEDRAQTESLTAQYQRVEAGFPLLPTSRDKLRAAMDQYQAVLKLPFGPERFTLELSTALDASPYVELQKLHWHLSPTPGPESKTKATAGAELYEVLEIDAVLNGVSPKDYRTANGLSDEFIARVKNIPGAMLVQSKLPFETGSQQALSAAIEQTEGRPRFNLILARKVAP